MVFLKDDCLKLRAVEPEDADLMWEFETDSSQWQLNGMSAPYSRMNMREYARGYDADPIRAGQLRLVIVDNNDTSLRNEEEILGLIDIFDISPKNRTAFIGVYIKESARGAGYASRAIGLIEEYAAQLLNLRILAAKVNASNDPSLNLFRKSGYTESGCLKDWLLNGNTPQSLIIFTKKIC